MLDDVTVTVRNENARVPAFDRDARCRLAEALDRDGVVAAMLIGSQARGEAGPLSDVDVAVWYAPGLDGAARLRLQLDLLAGTEAALGTDEIDIVMLNDAPPLMRQRAMGDAIRLVERDRDERVRLETRAIIDYCDTAPLRATLGRAMRRRIREGSFGRRPRAEARLQRLEESLERLEAVRADGESVYLADADLRGLTEPRLEVAIQVCIDLAAQVVAEVSARAPSDYADVFTILGEKGLLEKDLAERMADGGAAAESARPPLSRGRRQSRLRLALPSGRPAGLRSDRGRERSGTLGDVLPPGGAV